MKRRVLHFVVDPQPFEKAGLHRGRAKREAFAEIVEHQAAAIREHPAGEKCAQRTVLRAFAEADGKKIEDVPVQEKHAVCSAVPKTGELGGPGWKRGTGRGRGSHGRESDRAPTIIVFRMPAEQWRGWMCERQVRPPSLPMPVG